jgi:hypothetical protein
MGDEDMTAETDAKVDTINALLDNDPQSSAIERLEAWKAGHKSRFVEIRIDDWPGLTATIHAAIDRAEKLGL